MNQMVSINPASGEVRRVFDEIEAIDIERKLQQAQERYLTWRSTSFQERSDHLISVAQVLRRDKDQYARLITEEMGKPITQSLAEIEKCAWVCDYYAENAADFLAEELVATGAQKSKITYQPLGPIFAIMPWNFPFWQVFRFAAPNLMAGNVCLLKHASNVPESAEMIEKIFLQAGFPEYVFQTLMVTSTNVSKIISDFRVKGVTLTGSNQAGSKVAALAGDAMKKSVLELGGSDPYIILQDADLNHAAAICVQSRLINSGQSCIAAKRFIVIESVKDEFEQKVLAKMEKVKMGDPLDFSTEVGPLARQDLRVELSQLVRGSRDQGARCLLGGEIGTGKGFYFQPTILSDVKPGMTVFEEEVFGPVAVIVSAKDEIEAVQLANQSRFGLGAAVFTRDLRRGEFIATQELEAGICVVNQMVQSDPRLPFGGVKESGYGRELSTIGIREFVNTKSVVIFEPSTSIS